MKTKWARVLLVVSLAAVGWFLVARLQAGAKSSALGVAPLESSEAAEAPAIRATAGEQLAGLPPVEDRAAWSPEAPLKLPPPVISKVSATLPQESLPPEKGGAVKAQLGSPRTAGLAVAAAPGCATCKESADGAGGGLVAGVSLGFLRPNYPGNFAFISTVDPNGVAPRVTANDFHWDYVVAPTFWLGWESECGLGVRGRWFMFEERPDTLFTTLTSARANTFGDTINPPGSLTGLPINNFSSPGLFLAAGFGLDRLSFSTSLEIHTADVEATWSREWGKFGMVVSGGGRYARLTQDYNALLLNDLTGAAKGNELQALAARHRFEGGGPTLAWSGRYFLGRTNFALTGSVRGALLVGNQQRDIEFVRVISDPGGIVGGNQIVNPASSSNTNSLLPVLELELGLEYRFEGRRLQPFVRAGVVNQTYFNAGNAARKDDNLSLFGAQVAAGVNY
jgi:hypothetical protein